MPEYLDEESAKKRYIYAACAAYLGSLSIGTAIGYLSPTADELKRAFPDLDISTFGSIFTIGALLGGLVASFLGERLGRKGTILATTLLFTTGWLLILIKHNVAMLNAARFILGLASGIDCMIVPVYLGEVSLPERRGVLGTGHQFSMVTGILIAYTLGAVLRPVTLALACFVPVVCTAVAMMFMPESPTWLINKSRPNNEVMQALYFLFGRTMYAEGQRELLTDAKKDRDAIQFSLSEVTSSSIVRPLVLAMTLMLLQQLAGINAVIFYAEKIFKSAGTSTPPSVGTIVIGAVLVIFTIPAAVLMDRSGRRPLLLFSGAVVILGLGLLVIFYAVQASSPETAEKMSAVPVVALSIYIAGFAVGYGPIPWLMMSELLPVRVRDVGTGLCTALNWFCAFLVTKLFPSMLTSFGTVESYSVFIGVAVVGLLFVFFCVPETKGKSLADIETMFKCKDRFDLSVTTAASSDLSVQIQ